MFDPSFSRLPSPIISVFGSSSATEPTQTYQLAQELGAALARAGFAVANGGYGGVMEAVSRGAAEAGGKVIGVVASSLPGKANRWVQEKIVVEKWEQRLLWLVAIGDGYAACPGGTGTLVELAVAWEMLHKKLLSGRPLVALGDFWR
ncbi:MAG: LOG family protein, partial [Acidobacteria bacterium]|nr:LOG family protein [Acidobacteriota bacterium]